MGPFWQVYGCGFNGHDQLYLDAQASHGHDRPASQIPTFQPLTGKLDRRPQFIFTGWSQTTCESLVKISSTTPANTNSQ